MITNDERRRIAAKLRACAGTEYIEVEELCEAIECTDGFRGTDGEPAIWNRLADLVDPDSHPDCGTAEMPTFQVPKCDREALLALADDLVSNAECMIKCSDLLKSRHSRSYSRAVARDFADIAQRIREACGEVER